jgi:hypothetical protein
MNFRRILFVVLIMGLWAMTALAASPVGGLLDVKEGRIFEPTNKAFGDPTDFKAGALAGANYLRYMQADFTEDNAGNGFASDADPDDGGYGWVTTAFENTGATYGNVWGITANGLYQSYLLEANSLIYIAMRDAANGLAAATPADVTSAPNITFLLNFASLPEVIAGTDPDALTPAAYKAAAVAIWTYDVNNLGTGTATSLGQYGIDGRQPNYPNGLIAWDLAHWVDALMLLHANFPSDGYDGFAAEIADVSHTDSFPVFPGDGLFEPTGFAMGYTDGDTDSRYDMYSLGVASLIRSFSLSGQHLDKIAVLQGLLLDCQFTNGSFSDHYGAVANDGTYAQDAAYAVWGLYHTDTPTTATNDALYKAAVWLGSIQENSGTLNTSGGFLDTGGSHIPEEGSECTAALAMAFDSFGASIGASLPVGGDLLMCSEDNLMTFTLDVNPATPLVIGFEVVVNITGDIPTTIAFAAGLNLDPGFFQVTGNVAYDNGSETYVTTGAGPYSVNGSFFGGNGIVDGGTSLPDANLFSISFDGLAEGAVDVSVASYNLRGPDNVFIFGDVSGAGFDVDCSAPAAVTNITADPHHNRVEVGWTHDGTDVANYWIYTGVWYNTTPGVSAYPEYDDVSAIAPARVLVGGLPDPAQGWVQVDNTVLPAVDSFFDLFDMEVLDTQRGVYYYEVMAVDAAGNISPLAADNARATNYWLGDLTAVGGANADGEVEPLVDMTQLGLSFGETPPSLDYNAFCDVGPTDDWSRVGVPTTDNNVNFEDLMVFSMNFGIVTSGSKSESTISPMAQLAWMEAGEGQYALRLVDGEGIKGVHVTAAASVNNVVAGQLLDAQNEMTFLKNIGNALDASVAVMGQNNGFTGYGDLLIVNSNSVIDASDLIIEVRGYDNSVIQYTMESTSGSVVPREFALNAAFPNPFNPMTKISFSLPETQDVSLKVYGIDGKLVATLVQETFVAGLHEVIWNGQNDAGQVQASGLYFYRIEAGPYSQVQKMTLMK